MMSNNPALFFFIAALLLPWLNGKLRALVLLSAPLAGLAMLIHLGDAYTYNVDCFGYSLQPIRIDKLSYIFAIAFHIAAFCAAIYSLHIKDKTQDVAGLIYMGGAIAASLAGDMLSLFICWELTAISSTFLIWASRNNRSYHAGLRYLIIQVISGVLLAGAAIASHYHTGSIAFVAMDLATPAGQLLFFAIGIKAAFPLLHNWLQDAYPKATVTGTVILSAFTTKLAIYALARSFAGQEILIYVGAVMVLMPLVFALLENDLRRVLAYSLNNQIGFMVVAVGIGTELALNGAAAHAFVHIMYKGLLFMCIGAVLHRVGTAKASELGGLYKSMPLTTLFCLIGSLSASAFPFFSGFITKSLIVGAAAEQHLGWLYILLLIGSVGVLDHAGIKTPFFAFFAPAKSEAARNNQKDAPANMLIAMGLCASLCIGVGIYPQALYRLLPFAADYHAYGLEHIVNQTQLLMFALFTFVFCYRKGWYPQYGSHIVLGSDWLYRKLLPTIGNAIADTLGTLLDAWNNMLSRRSGDTKHWMQQQLSSRAPLGSTFNTSTSILIFIALVGIIAFSNLFLTS